ncbi:TasA family protein [Neobacillus niacini]|uniref:TasA family protein n=1 Tax=Neobacillus niacini TaxID=86668 RepID=UPI003002BF86
MSLKRKMGAFLLTTAMGASLIGAGTFALWTSEGAFEGSNFKPGLLEINAVNGGPIFAESLHMENLAPGDSETGKVKVKNDGNLNAWVTFDQEQSNSTAQGELFEEFEGHKTPLKITYDNAVKLIKPGETATLDLTYTFPRNAPNHYSRANYGYIDIYVKAVQSRNNGDANDNGVIDPGDAVQNWND